MKIYFTPQKTLQKRLNSSVQSSIQTPVQPGSAPRKMRKKSKKQKNALDDSRSLLACEGRVTLSPHVWLRVCEEARPTVARVDKENVRSEPCVGVRRPDGEWPGQRQRGERIDSAFFYSICAVTDKSTRFVLSAPENAPNSGRAAAGAVPSTRPPCARASPGPPRSRHAKPSHDRSR